MGRLLERMRARWYPEPGPPNPFDVYYQEAARAAGAVLDFGAGSGARTSRVAPRQTLVVGFDIGRHVALNPNVNAAVVGEGNRLPFGDGMFGLCVMRWVVEHLQEPRDVFREISRVLERGGRLIILTSNLLFYGYLIAALVPSRAHGPIVRILSGRAESETFPTAYRANTPWRLRRLLRESGFRERALVGFQRGPGYLGFSVPTFLAGAAYDYAVNRWNSLKWLRQGLIADFERC